MKPRKKNYLNAGVSSLPEGSKSFAILQQVQESSLTAAESPPKSKLFPSASRALPRAKIAGNDKVNYLLEKNMTGSLQNEDFQELDAEDDLAAQPKPKRRGNKKEKLTKTLNVGEMEDKYTNNEDRDYARMEWVTQDEHLPPLPSVVEKKPMTTNDEHWLMKIIDDESAKTDERNALKDQFSAEIFRVYQKLREPFNKWLEKQETWKRVYLVLRQIIPDCNVMAYGSSMTDFALDGTQLDLVLLLQDGRFLSKENIVEILETVKEELIADGSFTSLEYITRTEPVISFLDEHDQPLGVPTRLTCSDQRHPGVRTTHLLHCYANQDNRVKPLVFIIKAWALHRGLQIGGYPLTLMVIFFLQTTSPPVLPNLQKSRRDAFSGSDVVTQLGYTVTPEQLRVAPSKNFATTSSLLVDFFKFYTTFHFQRKVISVRKGKPITVDRVTHYSEAQGRPMEWFSYLKIEDPFLRWNVSSSSRGQLAREFLEAIVDTQQKLSTDFRGSSRIKALFF